MAAEKVGSTRTESIGAILPSTFARHFEGAEGTLLPISKCPQDDCGTHQPGMGFFSNLLEEWRIAQAAEWAETANGAVSACSPPSTLTVKEKV